MQCLEQMRDSMGAFLKIVTCHFCCKHSPLTGVQAFTSWALQQAPQDTSSEAQWRGSAGLSFQTRASRSVSSDLS